MKRLLSLLGVVSISASAGATTLAVKTNTDIHENQSKNVLDSDDSKTSIDLQKIKQSYDALSESEKANVAIEMTKIQELDVNSIDQYLSNSNIAFVRDNKEAIIEMDNWYNSHNKILKAVSTMSVVSNIDWIMLNDFIDLGFVDSNDYSVSLNLYSSDSWWSAIWDWGWRIDFSEGDINVMRIVKLLFSLYDGINFKPLESVLKSGKTLFDYLVNLNKHSDDKVSVLYDLIIKTKDDFKDSKVPFNDKVYSMFDEFSRQLQNSKHLNLAVIKNVIEAAVKEKFNMSLEEIGAKYSWYINQAVSLTFITNHVLDIIQFFVPAAVWNFVLEDFLNVATRMINADYNHKGVSLKFQQFIIPLSFEARS